MRPIKETCILSLHTCVKRRRQNPGRVRPARPQRCLAFACVFFFFNFSRVFRSMLGSLVIHVDFFLCAAALFGVCLCVFFFLKKKTHSEKLTFTCLPLYVFPYIGVSSFHTCRFLFVCGRRACFCVCLFSLPFVFPPISGSLFIQLVLKWGGYD